MFYRLHVDGLWDYFQLPLCFGVNIFLINFTLVLLPLANGFLRLLFCFCSGYPAERGGDTAIPHRRVSDPNSLPSKALLWGAARQAFLSWVLRSCSLLTSTCSFVLSFCPVFLLRYIGIATGSYASERWEEGQGFFSHSRSI